MQEVLTTAEVAEQFRVTRSSVYRWMRMGLLQPAYRTPGGHARFRAEDVRRLLAQEGQEGEQG